LMVKITAFILFTKVFNYGSIHFIAFSLESLYNTD
jgi:hypothetical protein